MTTMINCPWCGREQEDNPGAYYHRQECRAKDVRRRLDENAAERKRLEKELEQAEYVGD